MGHRRAAKNQPCLLFVQEISKCVCGQKKNRVLLVSVFPQKHQFEGLCTHEHTCKIARRKWIEELEGWFLITLTTIESNRKNRAKMELSNGGNECSRGTYNQS